MHSLGRYETERAISDTERKAKDEKLAFAVTLLCKAAGLYEHIGKELLAEWEKERTRVVSLGMACPRPPDLSREVVIGLSKWVPRSTLEILVLTDIAKAGTRRCPESRHPQTSLQGRVREHAYPWTPAPKVSPVPCTRRKASSGMRCAILLCALAGEDARGLQERVEAQDEAVVREG